MSARLVSGDAEKAVGYLNEAVETHFRTLRTLPYGFRYLRILDPDFLLQAVKEYLIYAPVSSSTVTARRPASTSSCQALEAVSEACPGHPAALYQLAYVQFLSGDTRAASWMT
jgi:tetratricopeptide repeat protein 21B